MALSFSGLSHAAEEVVESAVHLADTGHGAHAGDHPEGEAKPGQEHFCFGAVHNCGCCPTAFAAPVGPVALPSHGAHRLRRQFLDDDPIVDGVRLRVDRPPRA